MAHVFGFQHLLLATVRLFGTRAQFDALARATIERRWFWGNALNPLDPRATIERRGTERLLRGEKSFSSGARDADVLVVSATDAVTGKLVIAAIPGDRAGIDAARAITRERARAWLASGVERVEDDPYVLATFGDLFAETEAARYGAAEQLDRAWERGDALTTDERGQVAIAVAAAKVTTTRMGLEVTSRIFDATGARATTARLGLDRFWRNLRTHTLHDPVDYKRRDLGRWYLIDTWPTPSFYS